jgi:hypothetical protein
VRAPPSPAPGLRQPASSLAARSLHIATTPSHVLRRRHFYDKRLAAEVDGECLGEVRPEAEPSHLASEPEPVPACPRRRLTRQRGSSVVSVTDLTELLSFKRYSVLA